MKIRIVTWNGPAEGIEFDWPEGWPMPRVGELVNVHEHSGTAYVVTELCWYPGEDNSKSFDVLVFIEQKES